LKLPNLDRIKTFALDIETHDPNIKDLGPGPRRDGYICGVGIATKDREWYFPLEHPKSKNIEKKKFFNWLRQYTNKNVILANALYDLDFLQYENIHFKSNIFDVQFAEPLIDENQFKFNLDVLAKKYFNKQKLTSTLDTIATENKWKGGGHNNIWRMTSDQVAPYCQEDCRLSFNIFQKQFTILQDQDLMNVFSMECGLIPLLLQMKKTGVKIDLEKREKLIKKYKRILNRIQKELNEMVGFEMNEAAPTHLLKAYEKTGLKIKYNSPTEKMIKDGKIKGNPTFAHDVLEWNPHPLPQKIIELRKYRKAYRDFIIGIGRFIINGRIHGAFLPNKSDSSGTVTGRFSGKQPNLQQIPARDPQIKKDIRSMFIPENGYLWGRGDYSQVEFRIFAHYGRGVGADEIRNQYIENPMIDFHQMCADMIGQPRKIAKNINFGVIYGMGKNKLMKMLGLDEKEAEIVLSSYYKRLPFLKKTTYDCSSVANRRGYVHTILGRRRRFPDSRFCYKAMNAIVQGSAADLMKAAMVKSYEAGLFDELIPHLTVHDELDFSYKNIEAVRELKHIFETAIEFKIPIRFDLESGKNWAELKGVA
jgi:DNA polymerase I-like protein with 3'-5' exonuclease and polymerase domains